MNFWPLKANKKTRIQIFDVAFIVKTCDLYRFSDSRTCHSPQNKCRFWVSSKKLGRWWCKGFLLLCIQRKTIEKMKIFSWHNLLNIKWFYFKRSYDDFLFILDMYKTTKGWLLFLPQICRVGNFLCNFCHLFTLSQQKVTMGKVSTN